MSIISNLSEESFPGRSSLWNRRPARLIVHRHSKACKLQLQPLLTLHRRRFSRLQILGQNPIRLWRDLGEFLRFADLANGVCLLSLFAAAQAADEEVEAGEGGCDDEDYAHCNADFGAGEDRLVLREATRPGLGKPGPFPGLVMGGVALKRERALSRVSSSLPNNGSPVKCMQNAICNEKVYLKNSCRVHKDLPSLDSEVDITSLNRL